MSFKVVISKQLNPVNKDIINKEHLPYSLKQAKLGNTPRKRGINTHAIMRKSVRMKSK